MKSNQKTTQIPKIVVLGLILFVGVTFAYFVAQISGGATGNVNVTADTTDNLTFDVDKDISLSINQFNFASGAGNLSDTAVATAILKANSTNNSATYNYYVYFKINSNNYVYTTSDNKPEIVLTITDPTGAEVTSVEGLTHVSATNADGTVVSGFDITTARGLFTIADLYEITSASSTNATVHDWTFTVTFINLDTNQVDNEGKSLSAEVIIQQEEYTYPLLADYIISTYTSQGANGLYLHDATLANSANDGSYRYAGGDYELTSTATAAGYSTLIDSSASETTGLIKFYCNGSAQYVGYGCDTSYTYYYTVAGGTTQYTTYQAALDAAVSQGYLTQDNVKNFVCFGSDATTCPEDNLYRIIGIIDGQVKLIKYDYASSTLLGTDGDYYGSPMYHHSGRRDLIAAHYRYYWNKVNYSTAYSDTGYYNVWSYSQLNTVNLNTNYINNIGTTWANKIATTTWNVGGATYANIASSPVSTAYQNEILNPDSTIETTYDAKIGLMYASEYGYATDPSNWTTNLGSYNGAAAKSTNWMYMGEYEWTISRASDNSSYAFYVNNTGNVKGYNGVYLYSGVRPSFNLESSVRITGGSGTASDPYRLPD